MVWCDYNMPALGVLIGNVKLHFVYLSFLRCWWHLAV